MPTNTPIFGIPKPLGTEYFNRTNFNNILDLIESGMLNKVQMMKITDDTGGVKINAPNTSDDILALLLAQGKGIHTFYNILGAVNNPASGASIRGTAHFTASNTGWVIAFDTNNSVYTNYCDIGTWKGWKKIAVDQSTSWTNLTLQNSWVAFGGSYPNPSYRLNTNGEVELRGKMKDGVVTNDTLLATLPVGFRPTHNRDYSVICKSGTSDVLGRVLITTLGEIKFQSGGNGLLSLDNIPPIALS
ncbi:hypothetical protein [Bacillus sp. AFS017336]|uniref:hypothetical protein n=1 Tax=Bacillus sp. AFS017336 TaxID=2033489 RepID=UPI000BEFFB43|nr:hypothetical protein [Bacillus sp. AFS017336]PEL12658.1 hypothetical protein CN601_06840 [Bacillus sp. AFS017336]